MIFKLAGYTLNQGYCNKPNSGVKLLVRDDRYDNCNRFIANQQLVFILN